MSSSTTTAMSRQPVIQVLRNVTDPRHQWGVRYNLFTVLSLVVTGVLSISLIRLVCSARAAITSTTRSLSRRSKRAIRLLT